MSGIGSISNNASIYQSIQSSQVNSTEETEQKGPGRFEARINNALQEAGIDAETAEALKSDLKAAFEEFRASGGHDPAELKSAIDSVFAKYDLNAEDILGNRASQAGFAGAGGDLSSSATNISSLLETLFSQKEESGALSADNLLDGLIGLDTTA